MERVFTESTVRTAAEKIRRGEKPEYSVSETLATEDIKRAFEIAVSKSSFEPSAPAHKKTPEERRAILDRIFEEQKKAFDMLAKFECIIY